MALQVPCGKCIGCKSDKAMMWSIRCYHEASLHERNAFVTLTYEDAPPALVKEDLQKFFKRARHSFDFRYFACGEYGEATHRPHYHALIFGQDFWTMLLIFRILFIRLLLFLNCGVTVLYLLPL